MRILLPLNPRPLRLATLVCAMIFLQLPAGKPASSADFQVPGDAIVPPPVQTLLSNGEQFEFRGATLTKVASYIITGRVLSTRQYYSGLETKVSSVDLALGWSLLAESAIVDQLNFMQNDRRLYYQSKSLIPLTTDQIAANSSNNHIIAANDGVEDTIEGLQKDDVITLRGYLVNVRYGDNWHWDTSLSRTDEGDGACEIMFVTEVIIRRNADIAQNWEVLPWKTGLSLTSKPVQMSRL